MPELPEVETIRTDLNKKILSKKIVKITVKLERIVRPSKTALIRFLRGNSIKEISRRGKLMILSFYKGDSLLLVHLKMTGQLIYCREDKIIAGGHSQPQIEKCGPGKYTRVILEFEDRSRLFFNDMRTFGYFSLIHKKDLAKATENYGIEPLGERFDFNKFFQITAAKKTSIKAFLLNQKAIAGVGNIYADEILFRAGIRPVRQVKDLSEKELKKIFSAIKYILKRAIRLRGTTFNDYVDADGKKGSYSQKLKVYQRDGSPCFVCGKAIEREKIAGRGTHYCPYCQK